MSDKDSSKQTYQAQLDAWGLDVAQFRAKADSARVEARAEMHKRVDELDSTLKSAVEAFSQLAKAGDEAVEVMRKGVESAWTSLKTSLNEAAEKFKE